MADVIASIADALMRTDLEGAPGTTLCMMQHLAEHLGVDIAFLRLHDQERRTTMLYAEWPPRTTSPNVDPLEVLHFDRASPVIAMQEHLSTPVELHDDDMGDVHRALLTESNIQSPRSLLFVPVLTATGVTSGTIGLASLERREWTEYQRSVVATVASLLEMTRARLVAELRLDRGQFRDAVTRLPNRHALLEHLADRLTDDERHTPVVALMVRVSDAAASTERLGHDAADEFLVAVADRLRGALLGTANVFRTSTAEFVIVPFHGTTSDARRMAVGLQSILQSQVPLRGEVIMPRISIGIASAFQDSPNPAALLRGLRQAATHAQRGDGATISVLNRNIVRTAKRRHEIEAGIRDAIEHGTLRLDYQPEVDLRTRRIVGMEALIRWHHPTLGELSPESFLDVVDSMDLADDLGNWVLRTACAEVGGWHAEGIATDALLRVNVSPRQLVDPAFAERVTGLLADNGLRPGALCIEFTEGDVLHDIDAVRALVDRLRHAGVKVAIDDFGTGYSGFTRLKALQVDAVKIDKSFVRDVDGNLHDRAIVGAITAMADAFQIDVIAEGVETEGAAATLLELGCTYAQGFLFARPMPGDELRRLLGAHADVSAG